MGRATTLFLVGIAVASFVLAPPVCLQPTVPQPNFGSDPLGFGRNLPKDSV